MRRPARGERALIAVAGSVAAVALATAADVPAWGMGSGNPYVDHQAGVSYLLYQPAFTQGLNPRIDAGDDGCRGGQESNLRVDYGSPTTRFTVIEGNPICLAPPAGQRVLTTTLDGQLVRVQANCASGAPCSMADIARRGGNVSLVLPGRDGRRRVEVRIETAGPSPVSARDLLRIARSLRPVI